MTHMGFHGSASTFLTFCDQGIPLPPTSTTPIHTQACMPSNMHTNKHMQNPQRTCAHAHAHAHTHTHTHTQNPLYTSPLPAEPLLTL